MVPTTRVILFLLSSFLLVNLSVSLSYPLKVVYIDQIDCCAPQNTIIDALNAGYNVIVLAFYQTGLGTADAALSWSQRMDNVTRANTIAKVHDKGAVLTVSLGGANDQLWEHADARQLGTTVANFAKEFLLDGVDIDLEHFGGFTAINGNEEDTITWFSDLISTMRDVLGPNGIISMAPLPPWFGPIGAPKCAIVNPAPGCSWVGPTGGLTAVYQRVGQDIDYFFGQFYNQGACYTTEAGLFTESGPSCTTPGAYYPFTSVKEIADAGVPLNKIVIGKPVDTWAGVGFTDAATLRTWIENSGKKMGWNGGVGIWQWWDVVGSQAKPFLSSIYPNSGTATPAPTVRPTPGPTQRPTSAPTTAPTTAPTRPPTSAPTTAPTRPPTSAPTTAPTTRPTNPPGTAAPTTRPTSTPSTAPTTRPTTPPTPSTAPTTRPTTPPSTTAPTVAPGACTVGHMKCTGTSTYSSCAHGVWQVSQSCQAGLVCQAREPYIYCV